MGFLGLVLLGALTWAVTFVTGAAVFGTICTLVGPCKLSAPKADFIAFTGGGGALLTLALMMFGAAFAFRLYH